jgi:hypothetical protein
MLVNATVVLWKGRVVDCQGRWLAGIDLLRQDRVPREDHILRFMAECLPIFKTGERWPKGFGKNLQIFLWPGSI